MKENEKTSYCILFSIFVSLKIRHTNTNEFCISQTFHNSKTWYFREILFSLHAFLWDCGLQISPDWQSHQGLAWAQSQNGSATLLKSTNLLSFSWQNPKIASRPASNFWFPAQWTWSWGAGDIWEQFPFPAKVQVPASKLFRKLIAFETSQRVLISTAVWWWNSDLPEQWDAEMQVCIWKVRMKSYHTALTYTAKQY